MPMHHLAQRIEHTILKPNTTLTEVRTLCGQAVEYGLGGVCLPPLYVRDARRILGEENPVKVVTVVGFPMGYNAIAAKSEEIKRAIDDGADELDAVLNVAAIKSEQWNVVHNDIDSMLRAAQMRGRTLKLIVEYGLLTTAELERVCTLVVELGVPFVKTGSGYHGHPVTSDMVAHLRRLLPEAVRIKAAGGIRDLGHTETLLNAGAERIGSSSGVDILLSKK